MRKRLILSASVVCMLGLACTTYRFYEGEQRPKDQVAVIKMPTGIFMVQGVSITVDGHAQGTWHGDSEVLPGEHKIDVEMKQGNDLAVTTVSFVAEAGHFYEVKTDTHFRAWIVDEATGADVTIPLSQKR